MVSKLGDPRVSLETNQLYFRKDFFYDFFALVGTVLADDLENTKLFEIARCKTQQSIIDMINLMYIGEKYASGGALVVLKS
jgi:hypothetical protein